jgi:hypothetical protein
MDVAVCPVEGHVYVARVVDNAGACHFVKVGFTRDPHNRIASLHDQARRYGYGRAEAVWVSRPHVNYRATERALLTWCAEQYDGWGARKHTGMGSEFFSGLDPYAVVEHALTLPMLRHPEYVAQSKYAAPGARLECCLPDA